MHLLVIEDEANTAHHVCDGLRQCGHAVTWCSSAAEGERLALSMSWDLIVLDRMLDGGCDGLRILERLRGAGGKTPVLILSALATLDERVRGLQGGGDDYLTKPFAFSELSARVQALLRRAGAQDARQLAIADLRLDLSTRRAERGGQPIILQPREFRLLEYLIRHREQVVTRTMLLEAVWDYHFDPQTNVIDVQISRLRNKIDKGFAPPLVHTLRGVGYMLSERATDGR